MGSSSADADSMKSPRIPSTQLFLLPTDGTTPGSRLAAKDSPGHGDSRSERATFWKQSPATLSPRTGNLLEAIPCYAGYRKQETGGAFMAPLTREQENELLKSLGLNKPQRDTLRLGASLSLGSTADYATPVSGKERSPKSLRPHSEPH